MDLEQGFEFEFKAMKRANKPKPINHCLVKVTQK